MGHLSAEHSGITNASTDTTIPSVAIKVLQLKRRWLLEAFWVQGTASDNPGGSGIFDVQVVLITILGSSLHLNWLGTGLHGR